MASQPKNARLEEEDKVDNVKIDQVNQLQAEIDRLNEKASAEILEVEQRFNKLRKPLFDQRSKIIAQIPNFWTRVLENHKPLRSVITNKDFEVLQFLKNLEVQEFDDIKSGYRITLTFDANPYFTNTTVEKEFHIGENGQPFIKATKINWNPGKNLVEQSVEEAGRKHAHDTGSFFNWFSEDEDLANDDIGDMIKDELWVSPIPYFLSLYEEEDEMSEEFDEEEDVDQEDEVLDEEYDEEEEDDGEDGLEKDSEAADNDDGSKDQ